MDEPTLYDMALTNIVNQIHECSRVTESIEGKTAFVRVFPTSAPDGGGDNKEIEIYPTKLADQLGEVKKFLDQLHGRLCDLDNSIYTLTHLGDPTSE